MLYSHVATCTMGITETEKNNIHVYFNSNDNNIYVNGLDPREQADIVVCDISGKQIFSQRILINTLSFGGIESGVYIYSIKGNKGTNVTGKFFKG